MNRALLGLVLAVFSSIPACVTTHVAPSSQFPHDSIVVTGEGEISSAPDVVNLQLGVEAHAEDPKSAIAAANTKMNRLIETLKQAGIKPEDMQTRDFSIHSERLQPHHEVGLRAAPVAEPSMAAAETPQREVSAPATSRALPPAPDAAKPASPRKDTLVYRVSNMLQLTLREIDKVGDILSRGVEAGANQAWGISFDIGDPKPLATQARAKAVEDARVQAAELAKLAGVRLGRIVSIMDEPAGGPIPMPASGFARAELKQVPVEGGQLAIRRRVQVVFAIEAQP